MRSSTDAMNAWIPCARSAHAFSLSLIRYSQEQATIAKSLGVAIVNGGLRSL